ncbi:hypothetical protein ACOSQ2_032673 [Xanthoceras sorbifolium]
MSQFQAASPSSVSNCAAQSVILWCPPPCHLFKINIDASLDVSTGCSSAGAVIRNHEGLVMACCAQQLGVGFFVLIAESMAILRGLQLALSSGLLPALIESDCLLAVSAINGDHVYFSEVCLILFMILSIFCITILVQLFRLFQVLLIWLLII